MFSGHLDIANQFVLMEKSLVTSQTNEEFTPLHLAVYIRHLPMVEMLLQFDDTNLDAETQYGWKALNIATASKYCNVGKIILEKYPTLIKLLKDVPPNDVDLLAVIGRSPIIIYRQCPVVL